MIKISEISLQQNVIFIKFEIPRNASYKIRELFCSVMFYNVYKEKVFTIEIENWFSKLIRRSDT